MIRHNASYVVPIISANTYGGMELAGTVSLNLFANIKRRRAVAFFAMEKASACIYDRGVDAKIAKVGGCVSIIIGGVDAKFAKEGVYVCIMSAGIRAGSVEDQLIVTVV